MQLKVFCDAVSLKCWVGGIDKAMVRYSRWRVAAHETTDPDGGLALLILIACKWADKLCQEIHNFVDQ